MAAVLADYRTSPLGAAEKALFAYLEKAATAAHALTREDADAVRAAGWSDAALYDAVTVAALFAFYNTWVDATGVHDLPAAGHAATGGRLATRGYLITPPERGPGQ